MKTSKGVWLLAVLLWAIGSMVWLTFVMTVSKGFAEVQAPWGWFFLVVIAGICFLIPFLLVHAIVLAIQEDIRKLPIGKVVIDLDFASPRTSTVHRASSAPRPVGKLHKTSYSTTCGPR